MENIPEDKYEAPKAFDDKKEKYRKNGFLWANHLRLVAEEKLYYTKEDKELIKKLLYNPMPKNVRSEYWYISTGAKLECRKNPGYYQKLVNLSPKFFPYCHYTFMIDGDIERLKKSGMIELFKIQENCDKLTNILKAFTLRNSPSIGYRQEFHFIAALLFSVMQDEEKTFWTLTKIVEDLLHFNFFFEKAGNRLFIEICLLIMEDKVTSFKDPDELLEDFKVILDITVPSLYVNRVDKEVTKNIWDIFFIDGDVAIFKAFYFFASVLIDKKYKNNLFKKIEKLFSVADRLIKIKQNDLLNYYLLMDETLKDSYLNEIRKEAQKKMDDNYKEDPIKIQLEEGKKCDPTTPYCFYNKALTDIEHLTTYRILKLKKNTEKNDNYFSDLFNNYKSGDNNNVKVIKNETQGDSFDDILIERVEHVCSKENQVENK